MGNEEIIGTVVTGAVAIAGINMISKMGDQPRRKKKGKRSKSMWDGW